MALDLRKTKKSRAEKRSSQIQVLLSENEKQQIVNEARTYRISTSAFIRLKLLNLLRENPEKL